MEPKPVQKPNESWIEFALRMNAWNKERIRLEREKDNQTVKRIYRIA